MSEMKTIKFPGDSEPREIVDVKARESVGEKIGYVVQELTPKQQAQARENIGAISQEQLDEAVANLPGGGTAEGISTQKLSFTEDKTLVSGGYEFPSNGWYLSNPIYLTHGMSVYIRTKIFGDMRICFFDINGKFISEFGYPDGSANESILYEFEIDVPENTAYVKIPCYTGFTDSARFEIKNVAGAITALSEDVNSYSTAISENKTSIGKLNEEFDSFPLGNLIDDSIPLISGNINAATGEIASSTAWHHTDYIKLKPNTTYYVNGLWCGDLYAFYDKNKIYIAKGTINITKEPASSNTHGYFTTNDESVYIRMTASKQNIAGAYIYTEDRYVPYGYDFSTLVPDINKRVTALEEQNGALANKKVLVLGDSITDNTYKGAGVSIWNKWASYLSEKLGFELTNDSIHATGFVADTSTSDRSKTLVRRITAHTSEEQYDLIILFIGINDCMQNVQIGDDNSADSGTYLIPAMKYCLDYLANTFPTARICALLPLTYMGKTHTQIAEYINPMREVYDSYSIPTLDLFNGGGFRPHNLTFREQFTILADDGNGGQVYDGVHPNQEWDNNYLAPRIKNFLTSLF